MIVKKPIGAVKIGNLSHRLTIGKKVPKIVLDYWKKTKQLEELKKIGAIEDEKEILKEQKKSENVKRENEPIRPTENR